MTIVTIGKEDEHWSRALTLPNLEELTLHAPTTEQVVAIGELRSIKRLRITHARPRSLEVLSMWQMISKKAYPALLPAARLSNLKKLRVHGSYLAAEEYALLEEGLNGVDGAVWGPYRTVASSWIELPPSESRAEMPRICRTI